MDRTILSLPFLPSVEWFALYVQSSEVFIEKHEYFVKSSYMNRCFIGGANGKLRLSIPLKGGRDHKILYKDAEISYSCAWQRIQLQSIRSAYGSAPFFEHYMSCFENVIEQKQHYLFNLNLELLKELTRLLKYGQKHQFTDSYEKHPDIDLDLRVSSAQPKFIIPRYFQVFEERHGFIPNLSVLDVLFHLGPETLNYLRKCEVRY